LSGVVSLLIPEKIYSEGSFYKRNFSRTYLQKFARENLKRQNRELYSKKNMKQKSKSSVIQIRGMQGSVSSKNLSLSNQSVSLIWDGWGIGSSILNYSKETESSKRELKGKTIEFSYNFGLMTFGVGQMSLKPSGKVTDKVNSIEWEPIKSEGSFYFGKMRYRIGFLETLIGYRRGTYKFSEFKHTNSETTLRTPLEGSVGLVTFGIGVEF